MRAVGRLVEQGETEPPAPARPGQPANLADALTALRTVADTVNGPVERLASVRALNAAAGTAVLPGDVHETVHCAPEAAARAAAPKVGRHR